jgi:hypothetical protein
MFRRGNFVAFRCYDFVQDGWHRITQNNVAFGSGLNDECYAASK